MTNPVLHAYCGFLGVRATSPAVIETRERVIEICGRTAPSRPKAPSAKPLKSMPRAELQQLAENLDLG
eukprot:14285447-Alexandrium_andersonii.AAC.1